jgi:hypothetical protein
MGVSHTSANWKVSGEQRLHRNAGDYERVVLWMEHDSWDQLVLGRLLAHYANGKRPRVLELIAADEFPGSQRYIGLGQLPSEALRLLWPSRKPVTPAQLNARNVLNHVALLEEMREVEHSRDSAEARLDRGLLPRNRVSTCPPRLGCAFDVILCFLRRFLWRSSS